MEIPALPGVMAYGSTQEEAAHNALALAEQASSETAYLLGNPANADTLRTSLRQAEAGKVFPISPDKLDTL